MAVPLHCTCGCHIEVTEQLQGSLVRCPDCGRALAVSPPLAQSDADSEPAQVLPVQAEAAPLHPTVISVTTVQAAPRAPAHSARTTATKYGYWPLCGALVLGLVGLLIGRLWWEATARTRPTAPFKPPARVVKQTAASIELNTSIPPQPTHQPVTTIADPDSEAPEVAAQFEVPASPSPMSDALPVSAEPEVGWNVLYQAQWPPLQRQTALRGLHGDHVVPFQFRGPGGDLNIVDGYQADGTWLVAGDGALARTGGPRGVLSLGQHNAFEGEWDLNAQGLGGWFVVWGWNGQRGQMLYNITLQTTSIWYVYEAQQGRFVNRKQAVSGYRWEGRQPFRMRVSDGQLNLTVGTTALVRDFAIGPQRSGTVYVGTAPTQYGPSPIQIYELKIRDLSPPAAP